MNALMKSFGFALNGIRAVWREEVNFRIEVVSAVVVIAFGTWRHFLVYEWMIIIGGIGAVLAAEMVNTAIEDLCNKVEPKTDPVIGKVKDIMGGFVLVVVISAGLVGGIIIVSYL